MTNPTPHGQVPEALIDLIDAYAETRHRCGGIYNARTEAARNAVIEALSEVQALSAAPAGWKLVPVEPTRSMMASAVIFANGNAVYKNVSATALEIEERIYGEAYSAMLAASPTPPAPAPAEQQAAPKAAPGVGNSGFDHKTAADLLNNKIVSDEAVRKFVATSRWAHDERAALSATLLAMHGVLTSREAEIALLKKALLEAEAAPKAAQGDAIDEAMRERDDAEDFIDALLDEVLSHERPEWSNLYGRADALNDVQERMTALHKPAVDKAWGQFQSAKAAPQQEAQKPVGVVEHAQAQTSYIHWTAAPPPNGAKLYTAPQPAPHLPERDASLPGERQGLFRKFVVGRVDGSDKPGGKHHGCNYFVLDVDHDPYARPAMAAYAAACESTHPTLAADLRTKWGVVPAPQSAPLSDDVVKDAARYRWLREGNDAKHGAAWRVAVNLYGCEWDAAIDAALAAQGGK